jgi:hypothetical protein
MDLVETRSILQPLLLVPWPTESHLPQTLALALNPHSDQLQAVSIDTCRVKIAAHAVQYRADGKADDQAREERGGSEEAEVVVRDLRRMVDQRRLKKNWTRKWKTTGVRRKMATEPLLKPLKTTWT